MSRISVVRRGERTAADGLWLEQVLRLFLQAARLWFRVPGLALVVVLLLGLSIGANTSIFSMINAVLLRPLPYRHSGTLVLISSVPRQELSGTIGCLSYPQFAFLKRNAKSFEDMAAFT